MQAQNPLPGFLKGWCDILRWENTFSHGEYMQGITGCGFSCVIAICRNTQALHVLSIYQQTVLPRPIFNMRLVSNIINVRQIWQNWMSERSKGEQSNATRYIYHYQSLWKDMRVGHTYLIHRRALVHFCALSGHMKWWLDQWLHYHFNCWCVE